MNYYLVRQIGEDGTPHISHDKIICSIEYGISTADEGEVCRAKYQGKVLGTLKKARLLTVSDVGLTFSGVEDIDGKLHYQEWLCIYKDEIPELVAPLKMDSTRSDLFEGM